MRDLKGHEKTVLLLQHLVILIRQGVHCGDLREEHQNVLERSWALPLPPMAKTATR